MLALFLFSFARYSRLVWGKILLCSPLLRLMSLGFPRHANVENYKSLLLNKTHLPAIESIILSSACEGIMSLSFSYGHTLFNLTLNPEICTSLSLFNMQFHTFLVCDNLVFLRLAGAIIVWAWEESCNLETYRPSKILSDGRSLVSNIACSQRTFSNLILNSPDNPWISS